MYCGSDYANDPALYYIHHKIRQIEAQEAPFQRQIHFFKKGENEAVFWNRQIDPADYGFFNGISKVIGKVNSADAFTVSKKMTTQDIWLLW